MSGEREYRNRDAHLLCAVHRESDGLRLREFSTTGSDLESCICFTARRADRDFLYARMSFPSSAQSARRHLLAVAKESETRSSRNFAISAAILFALVVIASPSLIWTSLMGGQYYGAVTSLLFAVFVAWALVFFLCEWRVPSHVLIEPAADTWLVRVRFRHVSFPLSRMYEYAFDLKRVFVIRRWHQAKEAVAPYGVRRERGFTDFVAIALGADGEFAVLGSAPSRAEVHDAMRKFDVVPGLSFENDPSKVAGVFVEDIPDRLPLTAVPREYERRELQGG